MVVRTVCVAVTVGSILACGGAEIGPAPEPVAVPAAPDAPTPANSPGGRGGGRKAARDGKTLGSLTIEGSEELVTVSGTTLAVGAWSTELPQPAMQVLLVPDAQRPSVVVQYATNEEDSGPVDAFTVVSDRLVSIYSGQHPTTLAVTPGGFESWSGQCGVKHITTVLLNRPKTLVRNETEGTMDPSCAPAACPFVDVAVDGRWQTRGEILRNLNEPLADGPQDLRLTPAAIEGGVVRVRIEERKPEVTYLDAVWLVVDGKDFAPVACEEGGAVCEVDDDRLVLHPGERLDLVFEVGAARATPVLWAHGYYLPIH